MSIGGDVFKVAAVTDIGAKKKSNQDAYCYHVADTSCGPVAFAVICDGVGGLSSGETASASVVRRFSQWFTEEFSSFIAYNVKDGILLFDNLEGAWGQILSFMNDRIREYGAKTEKPLGTTFTGLILCQGRYFVGHVGDCRVYHFAGGGPSSVITEDQTLPQREFNLGHITADELKNHPKSNVLLQSVGTQSTVEPTFYSGSFAQDDYFLICCDGFYRHLGDEEINRRFGDLKFASEEDLAKVCRDTVDFNMANGERDNITIVCVANDSRYPDIAAQPFGGGPSSKFSSSEGENIDAPTSVLSSVEDIDAPTSVLDVTEDIDAPTSVLASSNEGGEM